jgi:uncharacterized protein (TIGR02246 family)
MRAFWILLAGGLLLGAAVNHAPAREADEPALRALVGRLAEAWAAGDGTAYGALFTGDADYVTFGGDLQKGRQAIAAAHQQLFDGPLKGSRLDLQFRSARALAPGVVVLHVTGGIVERGQPALVPGRDSMMTAVAVKGSDGWRITVLQVTRRLPPIAQRAPAGRRRAGHFLKRRRRGRL